MINVYKPFGGHLGGFEGNDIYSSSILFGKGTKIGFCKGNNIYSK